MANTIVVRAVASINYIVMSYDEQHRRFKTQMTQTWVIREGTCDSDKADESEDIRHFEEHDVGRCRKVNLELKEWICVFPYLYTFSECLVPTDLGRKLQ